MAGADDAVERAWREHWGRLLALLVGRFRDLTLAEDALGDAFEAATRTWKADGAPANPAAWLLTTARRKALDRIKAADTARHALPRLVVEREAGQHEPRRDVADEVASVGDDELRMLLLCCHPALASDAQVALALRMVLGVPTAEIARLLLVSESTMAARLTRAKRRIQTAGIPFVLPTADALGGRVAMATQTIYLCFTAGYAPATGAAVVRADVAAEAIRLARVLLRILRAHRRPAGEVAHARHDACHGVTALLALMLLQHARRDARVGTDGTLVLLGEQDRTRWHHDEIEEGLSLLHEVPEVGGLAEELRLQATIAARHAIAVHADDTDWSAIADDYAVLERCTGSPIVRLNRAVAVAEADGPGPGLALLDGLDERLPRSHRLPAVRGELLARAGDVDGAAAALALAIERCDNDAERAHLLARLAAVTGEPPRTEQPEPGRDRSSSDLSASGSPGRRPRGSDRATDS